MCVCAIQKGMVLTVERLGAHAEVIVSMGVSSTAMGSVAGGVSSTAMGSVAEGVSSTAMGSVAGGTGSIDDDAPFPPACAFFASFSAFFSALCTASAVAL